MGRRLKYEIFFLSTRLFLMLAAASILCSRGSAVYAGYEPETNLNGTQGVGLLPSPTDNAPNPKDTPIEPTITTTPTVSITPTETTPSPMAGEIAPTATIQPENNLTPTPSASEAITKENEDPPKTEDKQNKETTVTESLSETLNKILAPIKEAITGSEKKIAEPTPIIYPEIDSQWNTEETYYVNNKLPRRTSNFLLSIAGGLISGGLSLCLEFKIPTLYLGRLRNGAFYRSLSRLFL